MADGMNILVDGHEITINADQLTIDGKTQVLEPGQDVDISVNEKGRRRGEDRSPPIPAPPAKACRIEARRLQVAMMRVS